MGNDGPHTRMMRIDQSRLPVPEPAMFTIPEAADLRRLLLRLEDDDVDAHVFAERLVKHPGLSSYVIAFANYRARSPDSQIIDPIHASAFLGINGLHEVLKPLLDTQLKAA